MKITSLEYNSLLWFIMRASYIGLSLSNLISITKQDSWLSALIALVISIIPLLLFFYIRNYKNEMNIAQLNEFIFGKFGKFLNILLAFGGLFFIQMAFIDLTHFVNTQFLFKTHIFYIGICFLIPIIYALFKGLKSIARTSLMVFYFVIITIVFIIVGVSGGINLDNLKPAFQHDTLSLLHGSIIIIAYNVLPLVFLLIIPKNNIANYKSKKSIVFYLLALLSLINAAFITIAVFGVDLSLLYKYPEFQLLKKVEIGEFVDRLESVLSLEWIVALFVLITFGLYFVTQTLKQTFKYKEKTNKFIIIIVCLILIIGNQYLFTMDASANNFFKGPMLIIMFSFFFFIPLLISIGCKLKGLNNKNRRRNNHH